MVHTVAMLSCTLLCLVVAGVWSYRCQTNHSSADSHTECNYCFYNMNQGNVVKPELLWATSYSAVLRARVCGCWCRDKTYWYFRNVTTQDNGSNYPEPEEKLLNDCNTKEYCEINGSPGSKVLVYVAFYNYRTETTMLGDGTYVRFCPAKHPPRPENVRCWKYADKPQLRWTYNLEDLECHSYTQFVLKSNPTSISAKWYWLGEASPNVASEGAPFGGLVHRCPDDSGFLCANLSAVLQPHQVQLGVRRIDAVEDAQLIVSNWVPCIEYPGPPPPPLPPPVGVTVAVSPLPECPSPPSAVSHAHSRNERPSGREPAAPHAHRHGCTGWTVVTLVAMAALLVCAALLPCAFVAGRRSRDKQQLGAGGGGGVAWQQLRDDYTDPHDSTTVVYGERPPDYEYDYANGQLPPHSPSPPPLPPPPLPPPRAADVQNDIYEPADQSEAKGCPAL